MRKSAKMRFFFFAVVVRCNEMRILIPFLRRIRISHFFAYFRIFSTFFAFFSHVFALFTTFWCTDCKTWSKKCKNAKKVRKMRCKCKMRMRCESGTMRCDGLGQKCKCEFEHETLFALPFLLLGAQQKFQESVKQNTVVLPSRQLNYIFCYILTFYIS